MIVTFTINGTQRSLTCKPHESLLSVLRNLGFPTKRVRQRIEQAVEKLESEGEEVSEEKILAMALRSGQ